MRRRRRRRRRRRIKDEESQFVKELPNLLINTCVSYMPSNATVILVGVLFYHGYMFRRLIGP
jgi:hypothetical protein